MRAVLLHLAQQLVDRFRFRDQTDGARQLTYQTSFALSLIQFEHIADVHKAGDVVDRIPVDGDSRVLLVDDQLPQFLERTVGGKSHDVWPRRHHLADRLVAEGYYGLYELAVVFLDDAFLGAGVDQRVDVFGRVHRLLFRRAGPAQLGERLQKLQQGAERARRQRHHLEQRHQRQQPVARAAAVDHVRDRVRRYRHGEHGEDAGFAHRVP